VTPRRLKYLDVTRKPLDDSDDYVPPLGSSRASYQARREYEADRREALAEDNDRSSSSYRTPME
jgi:hypothetical protein